MKYAMYFDRVTKTREYAREVASQIAPKAIVLFDSADDEMAYFRISAKKSDITQEQIEELKLNTRYAYFFIQDSPIFIARFCISIY
jgi:hypothetical protein